MKSSHTFTLLLLTTVLFAAAGHSETTPLSKRTTGTSPQQTFNISGRIVQRIAADTGWRFQESHLEERGLGHIRVSAGFGRTTHTDNAGNFTIENVPPGQYRLQASRMTYQFEPEIIEIDVSDQDVGGLKFVFTLALPPSDQPKVCTGYNPLEASWWYGAQPCAPGYGIFGLNDGPDENHEYIGHWCCGLPASDILSETKVSAVEQCPEGFIATGHQREEPCDGCAAVLQCTKINTDRYLLGAATPGIYWGRGFAGREGRLKRRDSYPVSIRYAVGRSRQQEWDVDGCIASVPGALLTGKTGGKCRETVFRELQYTGIDGDPPAGTPVKMLPDCRELENIYAPVARCR